MYRFINPKSNSQTHIFEFFVMLILFFSQYNCLIIFPSSDFTVTVPSRDITKKCKFPKFSITRLGSTDGKSHSSWSCHAEYNPKALFITITNKLNTRAEIVFSEKATCYQFTLHCLSSFFSVSSSHCKVAKAEYV